MAQRLEPFSELRQLQDTVDRMWRRIGTTTGASNGGPEIEEWAVPLDVVQKGDYIVIRASVPGVAPDDVQVSIEDNVLTIKGQTAGEHQDEDDTYLMRERRTGSFHRALRLPDSVDPAKAEPRYEHGVLTITVPKAEEKKARQLQVQVGPASIVEG